MKRDLRDELVKLEAELGALGLTPTAEARLRNRLAGSLYRERRWWRYPVVALASCAAGVLLAIAVLKPPAPPQTLGGIKVEAQSAGFVGSAEGRDVVVRAGEATFQLEGASVRVTRPGRLRQEPSGVRLLSGRVELEVAKRAPEARPLKVMVSHGEIEVRGTRFSVDQLEGGGGAVLLWEGKIVFRAADGREVELEPGQSLAWPLPPLVPAAPVDESFVAPDDDALAPLPPPAPDSINDWSAHDRLLRAHSLLERVPRLREVGAGSQAAHELEAAMKQDLPATARERLSWELVDIYSTDLWNTVKGCKQAKDHLWRYPAGRYDAEVQKARREMGCER